MHRSESGRKIGLLRLEGRSGGGRKLENGKPKFETGNSKLEKEEHDAER
jgi:hypothetical protein